MSKSLTELHQAFEQAVEDDFKAQQTEWDTEHALMDEIARQVNDGELHAEYCSKPLAGHNLRVYQEWECKVSPIGQCVGSSGCIFCGEPSERK